MKSDKPVFSQAELEYIVINTLANLMVVVDSLMGINEVPIEKARESLLQSKAELLRFMESKE